jgi:CO dehydrogenase nickel-insertion accessory protein CooC1
MQIAIVKDTDPRESVLLIVTENDYNTIQTRVKIKDLMTKTNFLEEITAAQNKQAEVDKFEAGMRGHGIIDKVLNHYEQLPETLFTSPTLNAELDVQLV